MLNLLNNLNEMLLMGPGPSTVSPTIYEALRRPTLGHLDPRFIEIMDSIKVQLQTILNTNNELTVPMSGTGSAGMETCFVNLIEPKDNVLILINGVFGVRMQDVATRLGANVDSLTVTTNSDGEIVEQAGQTNKTITSSIDLRDKAKSLRKWGFKEKAKEFSDKKVQKGANNASL